MAQQCEVCGKKPVLGNQVTHRGKAKYLGGVGTKVTGISRRKFRPNLQRVHVTTANGTRKPCESAPSAFAAAPSPSGFTTAPSSCRRRRKQSSG